MKNKFRFVGERARRRTRESSASSSNEDNSSDDSLSLPSSDSDKENDENYQDELLIAQANKHMEEAQQQRSLARLRQQTAMEDVDQPHENRRFVFCSMFVFLNFMFTNVVNFSFYSYCVVCDYSQNVELPHFGAEQPQDIYYFSAITVNIFGMADVTKTPTKMLAYGYREDQGGKGGNNVASLIIKGLKELGWIKEDGQTGKQLTIILDNCGGQNKNNYVLRMAPWLVERKLFKKVEIVFYIRGHTKNACDRLFNQLKLLYHKRQTFTMENMVRTMNASPNVTFKEAFASDFFDYGQMLDLLYKKFPPGMIQRNHIFWVDDSNPTKMHIKVSDEAEIEVFDFKKSNVQRHDILNSRLTPIPAPGLKEIKQVELYSKFRKFVPLEFQDEICPRPSQQVLENIKKSRSEKTKARSTAKKRKA